MPGAAIAAPTGIQGPPGARAVSVLTPNTVALASNLAIATITDVVMFSNAVSVTGQWLVPESRISVYGVPAVSAGGSGIALHPVNGTTGPMTAVQPDSNASEG